MDEKDNIELLKSFKHQTIDDIEYIADQEESLIKITFTNQESFIIAGIDMDMYLGFPKDTDLH